MENKTFEEKRARVFKLPKWKRTSVVRFLIVLTMSVTGVGMMAAGLLAWVIGENYLLLTGVTAGAVFISAGGLGFMRCLESIDSK
ncbi:MAG: hypothetical protein P1U90_12170 [Akkermansiaceae bacterium]|jgi:hypothetical protein|nr:hypothetical protein [Akkermansiaceae bacterium]